jgi:hypothetical protein
VPDDELGEDEIDAEEAVDLERQALALEEMGDIRALLAAAKRLPSDTKAEVLLEVLPSCASRATARRWSSPSTPTPWIFCADASPTPSAPA